jgi:glycosyltransferase involved in cell wall biosynthesis
MRYYQAVMATDPIVSVIIPYSDEHTPSRMLKEAKESAKSQTVPVNIIIVRDSDQHGPAWARNRGLEQADTRYVAFLDADDLWKKNKLQQQLSRISETGTGLCVEGKPTSTEEYIKGIFIGSIHSIMSSVLIDTNHIDITFEESLERLEDWLYAMEATSQGGVCFCENIVEIRKHDTGLSSRGSLGLIVSQMEQYGRLALDRVPETRPYRDKFYRNYYFLYGRHLHTKNRYLEAIRAFLNALRHEIHYEPVGGLILAGGAAIWSRMQQLIPNRLVNAKE